MTDNKDQSVNEKRFRDTLDRAILGSEQEPSKTAGDHRSGESTDRQTHSHNAEGAEDSHDDTSR